jgi:hypothetical protein
MEKIRTATFVSTHENLIKLPEPHSIPGMMERSLQETIYIPCKNDVFWDVTLCGSCKNQRFGGT